MRMTNSKANVSWIHGAAISSLRRKDGQRLNSLLVISVGCDTGYDEPKVAPEIPPKPYGVDREGIISVNTVVPGPWYDVFDMIRNAQTNLFLQTQLVILA